MDIAYHYFVLEPHQGIEALPLTQSLPLIRGAFENVDENENAAVDNAKKRHSALLAADALREVLALYENPCVTRLRVSTSQSGGYYVEFDLWDKQGVIVYPCPDEDRLDVCEVLARKLAVALDYEFAIEEYD